MSLSKPSSGPGPIPLININNNTNPISLKEKFKFIIQGIINKLKNNQKKLIFYSFLFGAIFYFYKKYFASKVEAVMEFYNTVYEYKDLFGDNNSFDQVLVQYEICFNNMNKKLLNEIKIKLNSDTNLEDLYNKVKKSKREEMITNWRNLKDNVMLYYFKSIILSRFVILISQSHLLIIEKMQIDNQKIPKNLCDELLTDLWLLATNFFDELSNNINDLIADKILNIPINSQYSWNSYSKELTNLQEIALDLIIDNFNNEIKLKLFKNYVSNIANKINILENNNFDLKFSSQKIEVFLKFYQIYYDVLNSNLFHVILFKAINNDFSNMQNDLKNKIEIIVLEEMQQAQNQNILNKNISISEETEKNQDSSNLKNTSEEIDKSFQENSFKIKLIKILIIMLKVNGNILDVNSSLIINKSENFDKKFNEELNEYFKIIYD